MKRLCGKGMKSLYMALDDGKWTLILASLLCLQCKAHLSRSWAALILLYCYQCNFYCLICVTLAHVIQSLVCVLCCHLFLFSLLKYGGPSKSWSHTMLLPCQFPAFVDDLIVLVCFDTVFCNPATQIQLWWYFAVWATIEFSGGTVYLNVTSSIKMDHVKTAITANLPQVPELLPYPAWAPLHIVLTSRPAASEALTMCAPLQTAHKCTAFFSSLPLNFYSSLPLPLTFLQVCFDHLTATSSSLSSLLTLLSVFLPPI